MFVKVKGLIESLRAGILQNEACNILKVTELTFEEARKGNFSFFYCVLKDDGNYLGSGTKLWGKYYLKVKIYFWSKVSVIRCLSILRLFPDGLFFV
jgi:hypothetical protein